MGTFGKTMIGLWLIATASIASASSPGCTTDSERVVRGELGRKLDLFLERASAYGFSGAAAVTSGEELLLLGGYGQAHRERALPFTAATVFTLGSLTKQFTAAAVLKLAEDGKLRVEDTLGKFFDGVPEDKAGISLHHLLTHTAGLRSGFFRDRDEVSRQKLVRTALDSELSAPPGELWQYSNTGYSLLAAVVEIVSEKSYEAFVIGG